MAEHQQLDDQLTIRLPAAAAERIRSIAEEVGSTPSQAGRRLLLAALSREPVSGPSA